MSDSNKIVPDPILDWLNTYEPQPDMPDHGGIFAATDTDTDNPAPIPGLPYGTRQILEIENYQITSANYVDNKVSNTAHCRCQILVTGCPSPSSSKKLSHGYIRFVEPHLIKYPAYDHKAGRINILINQDFMQATLTQLTHSQKYLWIGQFGNGHLYADIHSTP